MWAVISIPELEIPKILNYMLVLIALLAHLGQSLDNIPKSYSTDPPIVKFLPTKDQFGNDSSNACFEPLHW